MHLLLIFAILHVIVLLILVSILGKTMQEYKKCKNLLDFYKVNYESCRRYPQHGYLTEKPEISKYVDNLLKSHNIIFDCKKIIDKESFWNEIQNNFTYDCEWFGRNPNAFIDALRGDCGLFDEVKEVNIFIINTADIAENTERYSLFMDMLEVIIGFVNEIKTDDYSLKYIKNLRNYVNSIYLGEAKFISLRLYENDIV